MLLVGDRFVFKILEHNNSYSAAAPQQLYIFMTEEEYRSILNSINVQNKPSFAGLLCLYTTSVVMFFCASGLCITGVVRFSDNPSLRIALIIAAVLSFLVGVSLCVMGCETKAACKQKQTARLDALNAFYSARDIVFQITNERIVGRTFGNFFAISVPAAAVFISYQQSNAYSFSVPMTAVEGPSSAVDGSTSLDV